MGILSDEPGRDVAGTDEGEKFVRLFLDTFDDEDRARVRAWDADPFISTAEIHRRIRRHFKIGRSTVERGLARLRTQWES